MSFIDQKMRVLVIGNFISFCINLFNNLWFTQLILLTYGFSIFLILWLIFLYLF